jgi:serine/threonine-protein kinase
MRETPAGFTLLSGTERVTDTTWVGLVERGGVVGVCKRLGPRARDEAWMRERLAAEGGVLGLLGGEGAPRLLTAGEDALGPWIVMEHVGCAPLEARMGADAGGRDPAWMERAVRSSFAALARVHARGVVHADLSPSNVLLAADARTAVLVDFGLARWSGAPPMPAGAFRGTLLYAAPEVARSEAFDARADVFALAASLLHVHGGEPPRAPSNAAAMLLAAGDAPIDGWAERAASDLRAPLRATLLACCAFDAARRPLARDVEG